MKWVKIVAGVAIALGIVFGSKLYNKSQTAGEVKKNLLAVCAEDTECTGAVKKHFDLCFDAHYNLGSRRRSGNLDGSQFTHCINEKAGEPYFTFSPKSNP
ncbi:MAG: hypothetical protein HC790_05170 [Acaryochloridaceae cyanobacterium CSU_3_4]|nr:hypothetical protein [Acaryochloridaceae cyanobacterium CSU_3_4]